MLSEKELKQERRRDYKNRKIARKLLNLAVELRPAHRRIRHVSHCDRPDLHRCNAYGEVRSQAPLMVNDLLELDARLALPFREPRRKGRAKQSTSATMNEPATRLDLRTA